MSLRRVVAAPFKRDGASQLTESEFVVTLSLHRDWYSPAQAKRVLEMGISEGLLEATDGDVAACFDPSGVEIPSDFTPAESLLEQRSTFEWMLDSIVDADHEKRAAVAEINTIQRDVGLSVDAAAAMYAARHDIDVGAAIDQAIQQLRSAEVDQPPDR